MFETAQTCLQSFGVEIDQERGRAASEFQVGDGLCLEHWNETFYRFQLDDQSLVDDEIQLQATGNRSTFVGNGDTPLVIDLQACFPQLDQETVSIHRFEKTRP